MTCLNKTVKHVFSIVMAMLLLCVTMSPSVLADDLATSTAANDALQTETPSFSEASPVTSNNTGVFDEQTMIV